MDSLCFLQGSLSANAKNLSKSQCKFVNNAFKCNTQGKSNNTNLDCELFAKQYYPYSYLDNILKIHEVKLPQNLNDWYNILTNETFTQEKLDWANYIFEKYKCKSIKDYTLLYMKVDVLLLADIFENFQERIQLRRALLELEEQNALNILDIKRRQAEVVVWKKEEENKELPKYEEGRPLSAVPSHIRKEFKDIQLLKASTVRYK